MYPPPLAGGVWVGVGVEAAAADGCFCGVDCCWSMDCDWKGLVFRAAAAGAAPAPALAVDAAGVGDDMLIPAKALVTDDDDVFAVLPVVTAVLVVALGIDAASGLAAWVGWLGMPLAVGDIMDWATPPPTVPPPPAAAAIVAPAPAPVLLVGVGADTGVGALSRPANGSIPAADMAPKPCG